MGIPVSAGVPFFFAVFQRQDGLRRGRRAAKGEVDGWMESGLNVVMNGPRAYLPEASRRYPDMVPVLITVEAGILRDRLMGRGRESVMEIERRLERARAYAVTHPGLAEIDNSGELAGAGEALLALIRSGPKAPKPHWRWPQTA